MIFIEWYDRLLKTQLILLLLIIILLIVLARDSVDVFLIVFLANALIYFFTAKVLGLAKGIVVGPVVHLFILIITLGFLIINLNEKNALMAAFCYYISNAIGLFISTFVTSIQLERKRKIACREQMLSQSIYNSMIGHTAYQGMQQLFVSPTFNQEHSFHHSDEHIFQSAIHPTTGFPMINEGFDIAGNPIGMAMHPSAHAIFQHDINPASGMPMMNDSLDIHGSPYGVVGMNDYHSGMSSGYNNDHYAHSSSSIDHYNQH